MVPLSVLGCICMADRGVVYLAVQQFGYLEAALISALALRALHPHLPITVVSDLSALAELPLDRHGLEAHLLQPVPVGTDLSLSRAVKTRIYNFSSHRDTLYLDADMLPVQPLTSLWSILEQGDVGTCPTGCRRSACATTSPRRRWPTPWSDWPPALASSTVA